MRYAQPYKDSIATMKHLVAVGHELVIISHRSRRPYAGPRHDLHAAARVGCWIVCKARGCFVMLAMKQYIFGEP